MYCVADLCAPSVKCRAQLFSFRFHFSPFRWSSPSSSEVILGFRRREAILGFRLAAVSSPHPPPHPRVPPSGGGPRFSASQWVPLIFPHIIFAMWVDLLLFLTMRCRILLCELVCARSLDVPIRIPHNTNFICDYVAGEMFCSPVPQPALSDLLS
jgi:hypothetical protein